MLAGLSLDKLVFDTLYPEEGSNVGAFVRGKSGDIVTSTNFLTGYGVYSGTPAGAATPVVITANNPGAAGDITLTGDGVKDIATLISDWNTANPLNQVTLTSGNGTQVPSLAASIPLTGGKDQTALDVNIVGSQIHISADLDGIYNSSTNPTPDNVGIVAFDRAVAPSVSDEKFLPTGGPLGAVLAADITKVHALDVNSFMMAYDGTNWSPLSLTSGDLNVVFSNTTIGVSQDTDPWIVAGGVADDDPDSEDPVKVGSRSRWGVLTALSTTMDRADLISDKYRRVYVNDGSNVAMNAVALVVGTSAVQIAASALDGRRTLLIQNLGPHAIFVGQSNAVTVASGIRIPANGSMDMDVGQDIAVWAISSAANNDVRIMQLA